VGPEITACMAVICHHIKKFFKSGPVGVQILAGANQQALSVAKAAGEVCFEF
jgi:predicted TIM-barrel enzyme